MTVITWDSATASGCSWDTRFLITGLWSTLMVKSGNQNETLNAIYKWVAWCMRQLLLGQWPLQNFGNVDFKPNTVSFKRRGERLANCWRGAFAGTK
eukprot:5416328-Karenia_brevis.AAC.1